METSDGKPCENEVDVGSAFCGAGHLCVSPPADHAPLAPTSASSDPRPVEDILAVSGGGTDRLVMMSPSAADDGGFVAMADVTRAAGLADMGADYRLLGGIAVMLHILRLGIDVPLRENRRRRLRSSAARAEVRSPGRGTGSHGLQEDERLHLGARARRTADGVDRSAHTCVHLTAASQQEDQQQRDQGRDDRGARSRRGAPAHARRLPVRFVLSDRRAIETEVLLPDAVGMLLLKAGARKVRNEERDSTDLWRCLEVAAAEGVTSSDLPTDPVIGDLGVVLR